jgi:hypothetical protein
MTDVLQMTRNNIAANARIEKWQFILSFLDTK